MNGGGDRVRWVRTDTDAAEAIELFTHSTRHVRVMPFLEGVPCSIHGFVLADGVAAFRPVEQLVLRTPGGSRFTYAGVSTWWDPQATSTETVDVTGGPATTWWGPSSWVRPTPGAWCSSYRR